jgi:hypothetical protein
MDQDTKPAQCENESSAEELNAAKKVFASMLLACKKLSLYPYGHNICMDSINQCHVQLTTFLQKYNALKLEMERERIVSKSEAVSSGLPEEGSLHFTLFRDGVRWLEFKEGIEQTEIADFLAIINKYSKLSTEPEGDIVTAFWEVQFPHIEYEVSAFSWGGSSETGDGASVLAGGKRAKTQLREKNLEESKSPVNPAIDPDDLILTKQEQVILEQMIRSEEEADITSYLDALLDSLLQHQEKENFNIILEVLSEEFTGSLARKEFLIALKILQGLRYVLEICKPDTPWAGALMHDFFQTASCPESLAPLKDVWKGLDLEEAEVLSQMFKLLNPQAVHTLGVLLSQPQSAQLQQILMDSIIFLASQDMRHLETMLNNSDERLAERLIPLIVEMEGGQSLRYLMKLARHPSVRVRREAVKSIFKRHANHLKDIFNLIDDKEDSIRQLVLKQLGQSRNNGVEDLLVSYLQKTKFNNTDGNHMLLCFKTLGKCGSLRSVPFLREMLIKRAWMPGSRRSINRRGAAVALASLGLPDAEEILNAAGRSIFSGLRDIVRQARLETQH